MSWLLRQTLVRWHTVTIRRPTSVNAFRWIININITIDQSRLATLLKIGVQVSYAKVFFFSRVLKFDTMLILDSLNIVGLEDYFTCCSTHVGSHTWRIIIWNTGGMKSVPYIHTATNSITNLVLEMKRSLKYSYRRPSLITVTFTLHCLR